MVDVMCMMDTIRAKRDEIYAVARKHKAEKLWVFGSCARGEETPESDVDFLVKWRLDGYSWHDECRMNEAYEALLGRKIDLVSNRVLFSPGNARFAAVVCKEAIAI